MARRIVFVTCEFIADEESEDFKDHLDSKSDFDFAVGSYIRDHIMDDEPGPIKWDYSIDPAE
jgi:hypothetical protein